MLTYILIGLGIGLAGSFHCIGMCGPLALALPAVHDKTHIRVLSILAYNLGRAITYGVLGAVFGLLGRSLFLVGYQQIISIVLGVAILLIVIFGNRFTSQIPILSRFHNYVKLVLSKLLRANKKYNHLLIGMVNGFLPCGLVYLAIASAVATGNALHGSALMFAFGLGTIPLMFALMMAGHYVSVSVRQRIRKLVPYFVGIMACLMILRGLNLGIPYVSPAFEKTEKQEVKSCCSKDGVTSDMK